VARRIGRLQDQHRASRPRSPIEVRVDAGASAFSTVIEVSAPDRLGLLFDLTRTFAAHRLDVHAARVATYGPRVIDVFYVTTADGEPVRDQIALDEVRRDLAAAADG
jgi:[protein-PII] uridylyltransferase